MSAWSRSDSCSRPGPVGRSLASLRSVPIRTRGPRCAAGWGQSAQRRPISRRSRRRVRRWIWRPGGTVGTMRPSARRSRAELAGLDVLADDIGDIKKAVTRFVLVARRRPFPPPTGADKTTVVLYQRRDPRAGFDGVAGQFAARRINMTRLESRRRSTRWRLPLLRRHRGHVLDERVGQALTGLKRICAEVVFLGSYPHADRGRAQVAPFAPTPTSRAPPTGWPPCAGWSTTRELRHGGGCRPRRPDRLTCS